MPKPALFPLSFLCIVAAATLVLSGAGPRIASGSPYTHEQVLWASYWTVEPGFTSTLEMKNNRAGETVTAHVSLYFTNGEEWYLSAVTLGPRQTATIDLNRALESLPSNVAARASREGTLELEFEADDATAIIGAVTVRNTDLGIAWSFRLYAATAASEVRPLRGLFWFPNIQADGFVAVHNISDETILLTPRFHAAGTFHDAAAVSLLPGRGSKVALREELRKLGLSEVTAGGIELAYQGPPDALRAHGVLYDGKGFSTEVDFLPFEQWAEERQLFFRTPRFAIGQADPILGLPERTVFQPFLVLHNFNRHAEEVNLAVGQGANGETQEISMPVSLEAGATRVLPLHSQLSGKVAEGVHWGSLEASYSDWHNGVVLAMVSRSQDGAHSIRSVLNWVERSNREGWYWQVDSETNTLLSIQNSDSNPAAIRVALDYYSDGVLHTYDLPEVQLPARGATTIDLGELVASRRPDTDGDVIPGNVTFGGYQIRKVGPGLDQNITAEPLILNRRTKNFLTLYNTGCCFSQDRFSPSSLLGNRGGTGQLKIEGKDACTQQWVNITSSGTYSSGNTSIATVGGTSGLVTYVAGGSTNMSSNISYFKNAGFGECFVYHNFKTTPVTVNPTVDIVGGLDFAFVGAGDTIPRLPQQAQGSPSGGSYAWTATPANRVTFDNSTVAEPRLSGFNPSTTVGDTTISVVYRFNNIDSLPATKFITARIFKFLVLRTTIPAPIGNLYGYDHRLTYNIYTNPGGQLVEPGFSGIAVVEFINTVSSNFSGNVEIGGNPTDSNSEFTDRLAIISNSPLPSDLEVVNTQDLFVGGFYVRTNTLRFTSSTVTVTNNGPTS